MKIANHHYPISMWLRNAGKPLPNIDQPVCPTTSTANRNSVLALAGQEVVPSRTFGLGDNHLGRLEAAGC